MRVLTCLLNWRTPDMTLQALAALMPQIRAIAGARVCIVDNDSQDGSFEKLQAGVQQQGVADVVDVLASGFNGGYGFGNNVALRHGLRSADPPDYFYLLNSDAFVEGDALQTLVRYLDEHARVGAAGGYIHGVDGVPHPGAFRFPTLWSELEGSVRLGALSRALRDHVVPQPVPDHTVDDVDWVPGASMLIRRSVLEQVGLFDETFFLYYEETDLCHRIKDAGWKIAFVREASVAHIVGASTGVNARKNAARRTPGYMFDSRRWYFLKHHGRGYLWACNALYSLGLATFRVRRPLQRKPDEDFQRALPDFVAHCLKNP